VDNTEISELLKQTTLFAALNKDELLGLANLARERYFTSDEWIHWEGDSQGWFYVIANGRVKVTKHASSGKELIVAIFTPGDIFGEVAVFDGRPYPASAQSLEKTTALGFKRDDFLNFLGENPEVSLKIINLLGGRIRDAHDRLRDMAGEKVDQRIASSLLMISAKIGPVIPFTRQEIADMTGITTETVIRVTTRLKEQGIISTARGEITIIDTDRLRLFGEGVS